MEKSMGAEVVKETPWYVLWVKSRAEKSVRDFLAKMGYETFVASRQEVHTWRRGERRKVERVLIPSVVFIKMTMNDRRTVEGCPNVSAIMRDPAKKREPGKVGSEYACISDEEMHFFRQMLGQEDVEVNFATQNFSVGDYVYIREFGEINGKAQVVRIYGDNKTYVGVCVSLLGCAYMRVPVGKIEKLKK